MTDDAFQEDVLLRPLYEASPSSQLFHRVLAGSADANSSWRRRRRIDPAVRRRLSPLMVAVAVALLAGVIGAKLGLSHMGSGPDGGSATPPPKPLVLKSVSAVQLAEENLHLFVALTTTGAVPMAAAERVAKASFEGATVREVALAQVVDPNVPIINGRRLWVVSLDPAHAMPPLGGPLPVPGHPSPRAFPHPTYLLVFVDSTTGKFVFGTSG